MNDQRQQQNLSDVKSSRKVTLPPPPYDDYIIGDYKATVLEDAEKLYNVLTDELVCEVINENVIKQSAESTPLSSALPLEGDNKNSSINNKMTFLQRTNSDSFSNPHSKWAKRRHFSVLLQTLTLTRCILKVRC
jgi:hypothetical protein